MRARVAGFAVALLLGACREQGAAPRPGGWTEPPGETPAAPTDVLEESDSTRPPPPEVPAEGEPAPVVPLSGSAQVVGLEPGSSGVSSVDQVDVDLTVRGLRGKGTLEVEFIAPSGHPYERRSSVLQSSPDAVKTVRLSMPVAGTTVATSAMSGTWQVRFFLDGAPLTTASFTLEP
ncbi:hypothetical protein LY474_25205 [Myxococcus stipitatus]|uniref:hypothetical protein n=1 Tax=Myxococcus stipitatus TaxID=83455 RepID=UPI001F2ECF96|nr:hypothetical protein [Myxococcus stipitatus]MCE9671113.1 hypothetical protein [Myxococcus stipitatus]